MGQLDRKQKDWFFKLYVIDKLDRKEIMAELGISGVTYTRHKKRVDETLLTKITTVSIENELITLYTKGTDEEKIKLLPMMLKVWEKKQNVIDTSDKKEDEIDMSIFATMGDPTATSS